MYRLVKVYKRSENPWWPRNARDLSPVAGKAWCILLSAMLHIIIRAKTERRLKSWNTFRLILKFTLILIFSQISRFTWILIFLFYRWFHWYWNFHFHWSIQFKFVDIFINLIFSLELIFTWKYSDNDFTFIHLHWYRYPNIILIFWLISILFIIMILTLIFTLILMFSSDIYKNIVTLIFKLLVTLILIFSLMLKWMVRAWECNTCALNLYSGKSSIWRMSFLVSWE